MSRKISVIVKEPGKKPRHVNISNSLTNLQRTVDGYIETVTICTDLVIICNEEGRLRDMPYCTTVCGCALYGPIIFAGYKGEEFCDIPVSFAEFKEIFPSLWEGAK